MDARGCVGRGDVGGVHGLAWAELALGGARRARRDHDPDAAQPGDDLHDVGRIGIGSVDGGLADGDVLGRRCTDDDVLSYEGRRAEGYGGRGGEVLGRHRRAGLVVGLGSGDELGDVDAVLFGSVGDDVADEGADESV